MPDIVRWSQGFLPTLKDVPVDAVAASHRLLVRAGFVRQLGAGLYSFLPLGRRSLAKLERMLRQEMEAAGAQEFLLPSLTPAEAWRASGRWDDVDDTMFRLTDRRGTDYCLAMTHEEVFTAIAKAELRSYRQLPQCWYQIGPKYRDEPRPRGGLLRVREFLMKDAYSFDLDVAGLDRSFARMRAAYERIFQRCGLEVLAAEAFSGAMGGSESLEFVLGTDAGEDEVAHCVACGYTANLEVARSSVRPIADPPAAGMSPEGFATPGVVTIDALAGPPYHVPAERQLKTLVYIVDGQMVLAVLRGDHQLNVAKLQAATGAARVRPGEADEVVGLMGAHPGSLGAVHVDTAPVLVDEALRGRANMVTGANQDGFHLRGVDVERDLLTSRDAHFVDLRSVSASDPCPVCTRPLELGPALEIGHIFKLGTRYSERMGAFVLDADGRDSPVQMGSYGIGLGRLLAAVVEQCHDDDGIRWPLALAPFDVTVLALGRTPDVLSAAEALVAQLAAAGLGVLYDDRDERAGVKLKDADLIGIPIRLAVSPRHLSAGTVEWKLRDESTAEVMSRADAAERAEQLVETAR